MQLRACWVATLVAVLACDHAIPEAGMRLDAAGSATEQDANLPSGYHEWAQICAKQYGDAVSAKFCAGNLPPKLGSLVELQELLELRNRSETGLVMTGHSTGVGLRNVTPLNPRAFVFNVPHPGEPFRVLAFARGEPFVELVAKDPVAQTLRFFLLRFHLPCETAAGGCNSADLLTTTIEWGWTSYTLYDEDALAGTTLDCLVCHQPDGPGTPKILRMQEFLGPWTHWFSEWGESSFDRMHGSEIYAGFPADDLMSTPGALQFLLKANGFEDQPNAFVSKVIEEELRTAGVSATWEGIYNNAVAGNAIPPPYFGADQTDPVARDAMIAAYREVVAGTRPRDELPDIRSIVLESALPAMSIRPKPGLDGRGILVHMCSQCHNSRLDQTLSRARFNVMQLDAMSRQEKDQAIARLMLDEEDAGKMPPPRFRTLSDEERALAIEELEK